MTVNDETPLPLDSGRGVSGRQSEVRRQFPNRSRFSRDAPHVVYSLLNLSNGRGGDFR